MEEPAEQTAERKQGRGFWGYVFWAGVILVLSVLSAGPYERMWEKGTWTGHPRWIGYLYRPLELAYIYTPLRKPLGMYFHLWCPLTYKKNGDKY